MLLMPMISFEYEEAGSQPVITCEKVAYVNVCGTACDWLFLRARVPPEQAASSSAAIRPSAMARPLRLCTFTLLTRTLQAPQRAHGLGPDADRRVRQVRKGNLLELYDLDCVRIGARSDGLFPRLLDGFLQHGLAAAGPVMKDPVDLPAHGGDRRSDGVR